MHTTRATSIAAKVAAAPKAKPRRRAILEYLIAREEHGATIDEIANDTGILTQTVCAERRRLEELKYVRKTERTRPTRTGRSAIVWIVPVQLREAAKRRWGL